MQPFVALLHDYHHQMEGRCIPGSPFYRNLAAAGQNCGVLGVLNKIATPLRFGLRLWSGKTFGERIEDQGEKMAPENSIPWPIWSLTGILHRGRKPGSLGERTKLDAGSKPRLSLFVMGFTNRG